MSDLATTLQELPWASFAPVIVLIVGGLWIWAAGRRILRTALTISALLCGAALGWIIGESVRANAAPMISAIIAALLLAALAAIAYRVAIAGAMAGIVAIAAPLLLIAYWEFRPMLEAQAAANASAVDPAMSGDTRDDSSTNSADGTAGPTPWLDDQTRASINQTLEDFAQALDSAKAALDESAGANEASGKHWMQLKQSTSRVLELAKDRWLQTPEVQRPMLLLAAAGGALLGLLLGSLASVFSASAITSMGGSLMWLTGLNALVLRLGVPEGPWIPSSATGWLTLWLITSIVGLGIQWTFRKRPADKPA